MNASASAYLRLIPPRMIDENSAHDLCGEGIEVPPILVRNLFLIEKLEIKLMDQGRRLQHVGVSLATNVRRGDLTQMGIDKRHELFESRVFAVSPPCQKQGDFSRLCLQSFSVPGVSLGF